ncbi:MAG: CoA-binding protein [Nitrospirota bacterium]
METGAECEIPSVNLSDAEARRLLGQAKVIAVVGLSANPEKPSHFVPRYLQEQGFTVIPVNPTAKGQILGKTVYPSLRAVPGPVDIVDVFRPAADVPPIVEDAITIGAKAIWMQEGIVNNAAADRARAAGLQVVMNKCMMKVHRALPGAK